MMPNLYDSPHHILVIIRNKPGVSNAIKDRDANRIYRIFPSLTRALQIPGDNKNSPLVLSTDQRLSGAGESHFNRLAFCKKEKGGGVTMC